MAPLGSRLKQTTATTYLVIHMQYWEMTRSIIRDIVNITAGDTYIRLIHAILLKTTNSGIPSETPPEVSWFPRGWESAPQPRTPLASELRSPQEPESGQEPEPKRKTRLKRNERCQVRNTYGVCMPTTRVKWSITRILKKSTALSFKKTF